MNYEPQALSSLFVWLLILATVLLSSTLAPTLEQIMGWAPK